MTRELSWDGLREPRSDVDASPAPQSHPDATDAAQVDSALPCPTSGRHIPCRHCPQPDPRKDA